MTHLRLVLMKQNAWHFIRVSIRYLVYLGCVLSLMFPILIFAEVLFGIFSVSSELNDLTGSTAKQRIRNWPAGVDPGDVQTMSHKSELS